MKSLLLTALTLGTLAFSTNANACAMCVDLYPETIQFDAEVSQKLVGQLQLKANVELLMTSEKITCTRKSEERGGETKCTITTVDSKNKKKTLFSVKGSPASKMLKLFSGLEAEMMTTGESGDETLPPTGEKGLIGNRVITNKIYSVTVSPYPGALICSSYTSCKLEIRGILHSDLPVSPN